MNKFYENVSFSFFLFVIEKTVEHRLQYLIKEVC